MAGLHDLGDLLAIRAAEANAGVSTARRGEAAVIPLGHGIESRRVLVEGRIDISDPGSLLCVDPGDQSGPERGRHTGPAHYDIAAVDSLLAAEQGVRDRCHVGKPALLQLCAGSLDASGRESVLVGRRSKQGADAAA